MPKDTTSSAYKDEFTARVKALREGMYHSNGKQWTAADMAFALGIDAETYRKYERRSFLPHEHLKRFAMVTGVSVEYLITGSRSTADAASDSAAVQADSSDRKNVARSK